MTEKVDLLPPQEDFAPTEAVPQVPEQALEDTAIRAASQYKPSPEQPSDGDNPGVPLESGPSQPERPSRLRGVGRRIGAVLLRSRATGGSRGTTGQPQPSIRGNLDHVIDGQGNELFTHPMLRDEPVEPSAALQRWRKEEQRKAYPEIVHEVSDLLQAQTIEADNAELDEKLDRGVIDDPSSSDGAQALRWRLATNRVSAKNRLALYDDDSRAAKLLGLMHDAPKLALGTWLNHDMNAEKGSDVYIKALPGQSIPIPLSNVVRAEGFDSWQGRGHGQGKKQQNNREGARPVLTSAEAIKTYAERDAEIPPVDAADAFVQPNGLVFFQTLGAHRTAAAMRRGQPTIQVHSVQVYQVDRNYFDLPVAEATGPGEDRLADTAELPLAS